MPYGSCEQTPSFLSWGYRYGKQQWWLGATHKPPCSTYRGLMNIQKVIQDAEKLITDIQPVIVDVESLIKDFQEANAVYAKTDVAANGEILAKILAILMQVLPAILPLLQEGQ